MTSISNFVSAVKKILFNNVLVDDSISPQEIESRISNARAISMTCALFLGEQTVQNDYWSKMEKILTLFESNVSCSYFYSMDKCYRLLLETMVRLDSSRINPTLFHATVSNILSQIYILADSDIYDFLLEISHSLIAENLSPTKEDLDMIKVFTNIFNLEVLENEIAC